MSQRNCKLWVVDDDEALSERQKPREPGDAAEHTTVRLHLVEQGAFSTLQKQSYKPGSLAQGGKCALALSLIKRAQSPLNVVVVAGSTYGGNRNFIESLADLKLNFVVGLKPTTKLGAQPKESGKEQISRCLKLEDFLFGAHWQRIKIQPPENVGAVQCSAAELGFIQFGGIDNLRLFAVASGGIIGLKRGLMIGATTLVDASLSQLAETLGWVRWLRPLSRRKARLAKTVSLTEARLGFPKAKSQDTSLFDFALRSNITISSQHDAADSSRAPRYAAVQNLRNLLTANKRFLNVAELFAGAGGMGLGFLLANNLTAKYKIAFAGEIDPVCIATLRANHNYLAAHPSLTGQDTTPPSVAPIDLRSTEGMRSVEAAARTSGGIDVLIGGPPCQGFSSANRNTWRSDNPHNQLVNTFLEHVERLAPPVILMENVQGILWTPPHTEGLNEISVADFVASRLARAGYMVFPKILDAVWYGVPQYRSRFFLLGIRNNLGYSREDFGDWGPYPRPTHGPSTKRSYVTVREAIGDLPEIGNGTNDECLPHRSPKAGGYLRQMRAGGVANTIYDHVTSRHADYVIERYRAIPPGGNWQNVVHLMTNYADVDRTHSNIYRRLEWDKPSITIGHYRKSMLIHPEQHRGLSLREAARLQSFPDWFRFAGSPDNNGRHNGLMYKQQQLANAVCPLVTKALAEFILKL
jgi:DNA-cytosine methyltransferase